MFFNPLLTFYFKMFTFSSSSDTVLGSLWSIVVHGELYKVVVRNAQVLQKPLKLSTVSDWISYSPVSP